jgi:hypothetical protein
MWLMASTLSWSMFLLGVVLMTVILLRRTLRYSRRRRQLEPRAAATRPVVNREPDRGQPLIDAPPELLRWQVEMHETARDLKAELDSKLSALQTLVRLAREERERLEHAIRRAERLGLSEHRDALEQIERLADQALCEDGQALDTLPPPCDTESILPEIKDSTRELIYGLADDGNSAREIAHHSGVPQGEVEMILNLRKR